MKKSHQAPEGKKEAEDERFREVYTDPRFMSVPQKVKKVRIDDRFKKALTSREFNLVQKVDKYGRHVHKQDNTMKAFYQLDQKDAKQPSKYYDEEGKFKWDAQSSSEEDGLPEAEESSEDIQEVRPSKRELDSDDDELPGIDFEIEKDAMQPKVVPASELKVGKRLAVTNMDWDSLSAVDLLALFSSLCKGGEMIVRKVQIYPSLYGLEQMKNDSLYGPPKDLFDDEAEQNPRKKRKDRDFEEEEAE